VSAYVPPLDEVKAMARRGNIVAVYREVVADLETPVSAYLKIARGAYSFLLESVEGGERLARYSFIGTEPYRVLRTGENAARNEEPGDPLVQIEDELRRFTPVPVPGLPRFHGGAVGYMAYEVARYYEKLPMPAADPQGFAESVFLFTDTLLVFDHLQHTIKVVSHARLDGDVEASYRRATEKIEELVQRLSQPLSRLPYEPHRMEGADRSVSSNTTEDAFKAKVERAKEYIRKGDTYQIQVSQRFERRTDAHPFEVYRALRNVNPSPYMYYMELDDMHVVGASPEMLVRVEDGLIETHPIAGTRRRGRDAEDEQRMAGELQNSEKERAEHIMLVDLARNDLGRVCVPGSIHVPRLLALEAHPGLCHLVSTVRGCLREDVGLRELVAALGEPQRAGVQALYRSDELTVLNLVWGPRMMVMPHNHEMWAVIGIYTGREDNIFWRRLPRETAGRIEAAGARSLGDGDTVPLGRDIIHSVVNPIRRLTGAIHVYGGDFFAVPRSEWDPEALVEQPYSVDRTVALFEESNGGRPV